MTYDLFRVDENGSRSFVDRYDGYNAAVTARGSDVLAQLNAAGGWWTRAAHLIVGPGLAGPATEHGFCTEIGVDPQDGCTPTAADLNEAREWLEALHQPASAT